MTGGDELFDLVRAAWDERTCDPADLPWSTDNPSRGQCGVTALVLHDHLGGELLVAEVLFDDGTQQGFHTWNRLPDGTELDLTRGQFLPNEHVGEPRVVPRPDGPPRRCGEQYALLAERVRAATGRQGAGRRSPPRSPSRRRRGGGRP